jgi:sulfoxide reductase heme-binding subunit YedZ
MKFRSPAAKYAVWVAFCVPALHIIFRYIADTMSYGEVIHETGNWSVGLLFVALSITPLGRVAPKSGGLAFFRFHRRALGVASFAYAALHILAYLERKWGADLIVTESLEPGIATGWLALVLFLVLAVTSNNRSVRRLGKSWKTLHRSVYASALLVFAHWILTALEPQIAYTVLLALCAVEALRWVPNRREQAGSG